MLLQMAADGAEETQHEQKPGHTLGRQMAIEEAFQEGCLAVSDRLR